jgi:hypothetical protein
MRGRCTAPPRARTWGGASFRAAKSVFPQVRPSAGELRGRHRRSTYGMFLHPRLDCKQLARKSEPETSQRASFIGCSTQEISRTGNYGERVRRVRSPAWKAAKQSRRLFSRRRGPGSSSQTSSTASNTEGPRGSRRSPALAALVERGQPPENIENGVARRLRAQLKEP